MADNQRSLSKPEGSRSGGSRAAAVAAPLLFPILLVGCSSTTFFYNQLDTLIAWYLDDYVDLSREQSRAFDARIDALLQWHQREELPRYILLLDAVEARLDAPLSAEFIANFADRAQDAGTRIQARVLDSVLAFGATLDLEQRLAFVETLQSRQQELREEHLERTDAAYYEEIVERFEDNFHDYLGRLTEEQKDTMAAYGARYIRLDSLWLDDRGRWISSLGSVITANEPDWSAQARTITASRSDNRTPQYAAGFEHNSQLTLTIIRLVLNQRTDAQDQRLRRAIDDFQADFAELAVEAGADLSVQ